LFRFLHILLELLYSRRACLPVLLWPPFVYISARTPPNTTFKFDVVDTSNGQRISSPLEIHVGSGYAQGLSTCPLDTPASSSFAYQYAVTSSSSSFPAAVQATATSSFASTSAYVYPSSNSTTADPSLQSSNADSSSSSSPQKDVKGLKAGIALLCLALIALAFMYYRLRKQMQRLQKGQSTVGRWMNHHVDANGHGGRLGGIIGGRQRQDSYQRMEDTDQDSAPNMKTKDNERSSFAMSETSDLSSRMSSFFDHRSASRSGSRASATRPTINPFIDTTSVSSPSVVDKALSEEDEEDEAFRSASQQRRHSETSSELSDVTVTSGGGSRLSSVTHSDLASNVGNASVVSDDHYHRAKASTISPTALGPARTAMAQYLDPRFALLDSKR
jgi:hypothetical protein